MLDYIKSLINETKNFNPSEARELEEFRVKFLGRKGILTTLFNDFKLLIPEQKKEAGILLNELKDQITNQIALHQKILFKENTLEIATDLSRDAQTMTIGSLHPVSIVKGNLAKIFSSIGFTVSEGPEIVDDWHNFSALNFPQDHPARDMQDTFFIQKEPDFLLRTHTSPVQIQVMQTQAPPIRTICIGRVYRNETISYKSHVQFHQVEGLYIDKNVSFADLKQCLYYFVKQFFGEHFQIRFRPSFFPFTEPSAEMDICRNEQPDKWMEILGCGMVHPNVLENCGIDSTVYTGYAFGIGIERLALLKYGISDIRILYENDVRFLEEFVTES